MIEIICGDSMQLMQSMTQYTKGFDMLFLDPPFFNWEIKHGDKPDHNQLSQYAYRLLKPNGILWLCGTQPQLIEDYKYWARWFRVVFEMIQSKTGGVPPVNKWQPLRMHENIWCMINKNAKISDSHLSIDKVTNEGTIVKADERANRMKIRYGQDWIKWRENVGYPKSVFDTPRITSGNAEYVGHPTQKPLKLIETIVKMSTDENDWILDPFAGSGTTLVIAQQNNRNCIGIEINNDYVKIMKVMLKGRHAN